MTQQQYLNELRTHLKTLPASEIEDILTDYREHFSIGLSNGKSESEISEALGTPRSVAQSHVVNSLIEVAKTSPSTIHRTGTLLRVLFIFLVLAPFNFLVLVGPFVVAASLIISGWAVPLAIGGASVGLIGALLFSSGQLALGLLTGAAVFFALLGLLGVAGIFCLFMLIITRGFINLVSSYVRWNINFINARTA